MPSPLLRHFRNHARYNRIANRRVYDVVRELRFAELESGRPGCFPDVHRLLNRALRVDQTWLRRFEGEHVSSKDLNRLVHEDLEQLRDARFETDERLVEFVGQLQSGELKRTLRYRDPAGRRFEDPVSLLLPHLFQTQIHHRGEGVRIMRSGPVDPPDLDWHRIHEPPT